MRLFRLFLYSFLAMPAPLAAAGGVSTLDVTARADVSAEGRVSGLEFSRKLPGSIESFARNLFQPLTFEPATADGQPVASRTSLRASLELTPDGAGGYVVKAVDLQQVGSQVESAQPPRYPFEAMRDRVGGQVWLELSIDPQGRVVPDSIEVVESRFHRNGRAYSGANAKRLEDASRAAAQQWTFIQPEVAGAPIATRQRVPVTFTPPASGREKPYDYGDFQRRPQLPRSTEASRHLAQLVAPDLTAKD